VISKKFIAAFFSILLVVFLAGKFVLLVKPSVEREYRAACQGLRPAPPSQALTASGFRSFPMPAPDFAVQDIHGNMRRLSEFRGQVVFLNYWATWCPPCKEEVPSIEALQDRLGDDFVVLALASSSDWQPIVKEFPLGTNMTVLLDPPASQDEQIGRIARAYGVPALPETFVIDRQGFIRYYFVNKRDWKSDVAVTCLRSVIDEKEGLTWLKSWLWTMSSTSFES
jgi:peroxiredoxin